MMALKIIPPAFPPRRKLLPKRPLLLQTTLLGRRLHPRKDPEKVVQHVLSSVKDGDIVLLHERSSTVEALPAIIEGIQKMGYAFKKIPEK